MQNIKIKFYFFICVFYTLPVHADTAIEISTKLLDFDYEEFEESGDSFNTENGIIPGVSISATSSDALSHYTNSIGFEVYDGQVDYDGGTQAGIPLVTNTNETIYRLFYKLNWSPENDDSSIYGKITWQQWDRDILPTNISSRLFEQYQWWAFELGVAAPLYKDNLNSWVFELGVARISNGTIEIDLSQQGFGQPKLKLGNGSGVTAALLYQRSITDRSELGLSLQYQHWTFGRSNTETISNGASTIDITEPRSVSRHGTISLNYKYHF